MNALRPAFDPLAAVTSAAVRRTLQGIVRRLVPSSADFCVVHVASKGTIRAIAGAHATRRGERLLRMLMRSYRIAPDDGASGVASVMRTRRPLVRTAIQMDSAVARRGNASVVQLHRLLAPRSALVVPILSPPVSVLGALTLCYSQSGRMYSARNVRAAERAAARIAQVLQLPAPEPARPTNRSLREGTIVRRRPAAHN
jgi:GAF domain-containing protein